MNSRAQHEARTQVPLTPEELSSVGIDANLVAQLRLLIDRAPTDRAQSDELSLFHVKRTPL